MCRLLPGRASTPLVVVRWRLFPFFTHTLPCHSPTVVVWFTEGMERIARVMYMYANELAADCKHGCKKSAPAGEIEALAGNERDFCNHIESMVRADRLRRVQTGSI